MRLARTARPVRSPTGIRCARFFFSWLAGPGLSHKDGRNPHNAEIGYLINKTIAESGPDAVPALFMKTFGESVDALWQSYQTTLR